MSNNLVNSNVINCLKAGDIVDGVIKEKMKHGWRVKIASALDAIMPFSEFDVNVFRKPEDFINRVMKFRILEFSQSPYQLIVSRLNSLIKNMVIEGTVSHICRIDEGQWRWMPQQIRNFMDVLIDFDNTYLRYSTTYHHTIPETGYRLREKKKLAKKFFEGQRVELTYIGNRYYWELFKLNPVSRTALTTFANQYHVNSIIDGVIYYQCADGFLVKVDNLSAWLPNSEVDNNAHRKLSECIGKSMSFRIRSINTVSQKITLSRKRLERTDTSEEKSNSGYGAINDLQQEIQGLRSQIQQLHEQLGEKNLKSTIEKHDPYW